jgi:Zn-finger protein
MTEKSDLPLDSLPPVGPHRAGRCRTDSEGRVVVTCPDCSGATIAVVHNEEEAVDVVMFHAREMEA